MTTSTPDGDTWHVPVRQVPADVRQGQDATTCPQHKPANLRAGARQRTVDCLSEEWGACRLSGWVWAALLEL